MAAYMGMAALSIDILLPAFPDIRREFALPPDSARVSLLITAFFFGMAVGQLFYGPLSDGVGRKRPLAVGLVIFAVAGVGTVMATSLGAMVIWRFVWGFGAAAPRSLTMAMIRDTSEGDAMARLLSMIMATFILVPVFAPSVAALLLKVTSWRWVFAVPIVMAVVQLVTLRWLPETLAPQRRRSVGPSALVEAARAVVTSRRSMGYGLAVVFLFGVMSSYIGGSELIFDDVYGEGSRFPLIFAVVAVCFGTASLFNGRVVGMFGLARVLRVGSLLAVALAALMAAVIWFTDGKPPLIVFIALLCLMLPVTSALVPNCNTAAMMPLPHVAGMATALLGTASTAGGALLGALSNRAFDNSARPFAGFAFLYIALAAASIRFLGQPTRDGVGR